MDNNDAPLDQEFSIGIGLQSVFAGRRESNAVHLDNYFHDVGLDKRWFLFVRVDQS